MWNEWVKAPLNHTHHTVQRLTCLINFPLIIIYVHECMHPRNCDVTLPDAVRTTFFNFTSHKHAFASSYISSYNTLKLQLLFHRSQIENAEGAITIELDIISFIGDDIVKSVCQSCSLVIRTPRDLRSQESM